MFCHMPTLPTTSRRWGLSKYTAENYLGSKCRTEKLIFKCLHCIADCSFFIAICCTMTDTFICRNKVTAQMLTCIADC